LWKGRGRIKGKEGREKGRGEMGVVARRGKGECRKNSPKIQYIGIMEMPRAMHFLESFFFHAQHFIVLKSSKL